MKRSYWVIIAAVVVAIVAIGFLIGANMPTDGGSGSKEVPVETNSGVVVHGDSEQVGLASSFVPDDRVPADCGKKCSRSRVHRPLHARSKPAPIARTPRVELMLARGQKCGAHEVEVWANNLAGDWMWTFNFKRTVCWQPGSDTFTVNHVNTWTEIGNEPWNIWQDGGSDNGPQVNRGTHPNGVKWWSIRTFRTFNMCFTFCYADWHVSAEQNYDTSGGYAWSRTGQPGT